MVVAPTLGCIAALECNLENTLMSSPKFNIHGACLSVTSVTVNVAKQWHQYLFLEYSMWYNNLQLCMTVPMCVCVCVCHAYTEDMQAHHFWKLEPDSKIIVINYQIICTDEGSWLLNRNINSIWVKFEVGWETDMCTVHVLMCKSCHLGSLSFKDKKGVTPWDSPWFYFGRGQIASEGPTCACRALQYIYNLAFQKAAENLRGTTMGITDKCCEEDIFCIGLGLSAGQWLTLNTS